MEIITTYGNLKEFKFWGKAREFTSQIPDEEFLVITQYLTEVFEDGIEDSTLNDIFCENTNWITNIMKNKQIKTPLTGLKVLSNIDNLKKFDFLLGAKEFADKLTDEEFNILTKELEEVYQEPVHEFVIQFAFWIARDWLCYILSRNLKTIILPSEIMERTNRKGGVKK